MKILLFACLIFCGLTVYGQKDPVEITPDLLQKITNEVEKEIPQFRKKLSKEGLSATATEFAIDTFRIERILSKRMDIDFTTYGMNASVEQQAAGYDKLLNKYYNKLLKVLSAEDKKILIKAQKAWLAFRDAEIELISAMTKDEYSGGGSMQSNIATGSVAQLTIDRAISIFDYYNEMIQNQ
jgi:uncharacterized protein YecT (DUF1311 family)